MKSIRRSVVVAASLALVGGCSLSPLGEGSDTGTASSTSSPTSTQETRTETVTETGSSSPAGAGTGFETSASVTRDTTSSTPDGSGRSAPDAEQAVEDFGEAVRDEDFDAICDAFDPEITKAMETEGQDCSEALEENWDEVGEDIPEDAEMDVQRSELSDDGDTATVTVRNDDGDEEDIPLKKIGGEWKISIDEL